MSAKKIAVHVGLFVAACITTGIQGGPYFAATLMTILAVHESGHYFFGRYHGVAVSLPYFIPLPPGISLGTLGAVIQMDQDGISDRNKLFDIGASGPIAGLVVAIPLLCIGLYLSEVGPVQPGSMIEGNSILYALLKYCMFGRWLPGDGVDVQLHPMALAGWVGLLITMINLMPIGQLDGGHVARSVFGQKHETWSKRLHYVLPVVGLAVGGVMFGAAMSAGREVGAALSYAKYGVIPWVMWTILLGLMRRQGGEYHPPVDDALLDPRRRRMAIVVFVIFVLIATPVPFRPVL